MGHSFDRPAGGGDSRQVQSLEHELRHPPGASPAVIGGMGEYQLVPGTGHPDIEEAPLLLHVRIAVGQRFAHQFRRHGQWLAASPSREATVDQAGHEDDRELQALGLVHRQYRDCVRVGIDLGRGGVVARIDQRLKVPGHEDRPIVGQQVRLGPDDLEEAGDVLEGLLGGHRVRRGQRGQDAAVSQELVEDLARRPLMGQFSEAAQIRHEPLERRPRFGR